MPLSKSEIVGKGGDWIIRGERESNVKDLEKRTLRRYYFYSAILYLYFIFTSFLSLYIYKNLLYFVFFLYLAMMIYVFYITVDVVVVKLSQWKIKRIKKDLENIKKQVVKGEISDIDFKRGEAILENEEIKSYIRKLKAEVELKYLLRFNISRFLLAKSYIEEMLKTPLPPSEVTRDYIMRQLLVNSAQQRGRKKTSKEHLLEMMGIIKEILVPKPHEYERIKERSLRARLNKLKSEKK